MNNIVISPDEQRFTFERIVSSLAAQKGLTPDQIKETYKIFPSVVKMPVALDPGLSTYNLSPRKGVNTAVPGEIKLDQNDFFAVDGIGLRFTRATYTAASGALSQQGNYPELTYPDAVYFDGNPAAGLDEWQCLQTILRGTVSIQVTGDTLLDSLSAQELVYKGETGYNGTGPVLPQFGGTQGQRGIFPLTPQIILDASADNNFVISLADGDKAVIDGSVDNAGAATTHRNILMAVMYGWKIKNMAGGGYSACRV